jgi:FtsP/CotA-like multicopper oxidase with cupredoxin domain
MISRRCFGLLSGLAASSTLVPRPIWSATAPDVSLQTAPCTLEASPKHRFHTVAYNGQIPGPLISMRQGQEQTIEIRNLSGDPEVVNFVAAKIIAEVEFVTNDPGRTLFHCHRQDPMDRRLMMVFLYA